MLSIADLWKLEGFLYKGEISFDWHTYHETAWLDLATSLLISETESERWLGVSLTSCLVTASLREGDPMRARRVAMHMQHLGVFDEFAERYIRAIDDYVEESEE